MAKNVRFRYRLGGLDSDWTQTAEWDARYSGLKPGKYVFEVESGAWDGHWSPVPAQLSFVVTGPIWTSPWFTTCWMGSLAILAFATWRVRDRAHVQREKQLGEAVSVRTVELEKERQREKARNRIFENLVSNQSIGEVLDGVAELLCDQIAGGTAVILLKNAAGWYVAGAPRCLKSDGWVAALETPAAIPIEIFEGPWLCLAPADQAWRTFVAHAGDTVPGAIGSVPIGGPDGNVGAIVFLYSEPPGPEPWMEILASAARFSRIVIEHSRFYDDLQFQAHHDSLTGLPNRAWFADKLSGSLTAAGELGKNLAILFIDIDRFKEINDRLSHRAGDIVLSTLANRMKRVLRSGDTVARIGGDEFIILLEDIAGADTAAHIASAVLAAIREPFSIDGVLLNVSASIGIAVYPDDAVSPEELQREADAAMYCAKNLGRNRMQIFGSRDLALDTDHIEQALRHALQDGLFTVHYQTKVDADGTFAGFEALLRLNHPKLGNVPPADFIPVAEAKGLMVPVGTWVLDEVCRQIAEWRDRGFGEIPVAINVSALQLSRPDFADTVRECLARRSVAPGCVELELTESQALSGADNAMEQMKALRELGIRFSIDDFGAGYSSLSYLYRLHVDAIKLDRSFVQSINTDEGARRVVQAMIGVAEALGLNVIAEGVENEEQRAVLLASGCRFMQGYLFSRPQCAAAYDSMLSARLPAGGDLSTAGNLSRLYSAIDAESEVAAVS
jgi:diguanylate cyclase (GGDEF)-like protein